MSVNNSNIMPNKNTDNDSETHYYEENFDLPLQKLDIVEEGKDVFFKGIAVTTDRVSELELIDIDKYFKNMPVTYRHDHPSKGKGGTIYGRVTEHNITLEDKEDGTKKGILNFTAKMHTVLQKHRDLIAMYKEQEKIGKPNGWSIGVTAIKDSKTNVPIQADIFEISTTNNPYDRSAINEVIIMEEKDKQKVVEELQKQFEEKYNIKIKEFESSIKSKDETISTLESKVKEFEDKVKTQDELVATVKTYEASLKATQEKLVLMENEAELAKRTPFVEKIFAYEGSEKMKARYLDSAKWSIEDLKDRLKEFEEKNPSKLTNRVITKTLEDSRMALMDADKFQEAKEYESKVKPGLSPELKKLLGW